MSPEEGQKLKHRKAKKKHTFLMTKKRVKGLKNEWKAKSIPIV